MLKKVFGSLSMVSLLGVPVVMSGGCASTQGVSDGDVGDVSGPVFVEGRTATMWVKGMTCPFCVQNVDKQISGMEGVDGVDVDLDTGLVRVLLAEEGAPSRAELVSKVGDSGFTLDRIEMP